MQCLYIKYTYLWNSDLVTLLEEFGILLNEFLGWDILDGHTILTVNAVQLNLYSKSSISVFLVVS